MVAQNQDGIFCTSDKNFLGTVAANLVGSKYQIRGQVQATSTAQASCSQCRFLLGDWEFGIV
jgi:hypothetical protein